MNINHLIYLIFPFGVAILAQEILNIPDTSYWFYVWVLCLVSIFIFVKMILPYFEQRFNAISPIDYKGAFQDKNKDQKPYTYIVGFHMAVLFGIIIIYFIK